MLYWLCGHVHARLGREVVRYYAILFLLYWLRGHVEGSSLQRCGEEHVRVGRDVVVAPYNIILTILYTI